MTGVVEPNDPSEKKEPEVQTYLSFSPTPATTNPAIVFSSSATSLATSGPPVTIIGSQLSSGDSLVQPVPPVPPITPSVDNSSTPTGVAAEPVSLVQVVHLILGALVTIGWLKVDNATVDTLGTIIAAGLSVAAQWWARSRVAPIKQNVKAKN